MFCFIFKQKRQSEVCVCERKRSTRGKYVCVTVTVLLFVHIQLIDCTCAQMAQIFSPLASFSHSLRLMISFSQRNHLIKRFAPDSLNYRLPLFSDRVCVYVCRVYKAHLQERKKRNIANY